MSADKKNAENLEAVDPGIEAMVDGGVSPATHLDADTSVENEPSQDTTEDGPDALGTVAEAGAVETDGGLID
ncbi:MAG: hypothetical protein QM774_09715 [Gordonia sp. (in: high G+C Gram-positive bacteria)]|uniref:hypothetical protein n=1 Tax=Gordonia sp. (in: high G+C Gram-positive bacteria) TaxID=84139 RepID=UPI0039E244BD